MGLNKTTDEKYMMIKNTKSRVENVRINVGNVFWLWHARKYVHVAKGSLVTWQCRDANSLLGDLHRGMSFCGVRNFLKFRKY